MDIDTFKHRISYSPAFIFDTSEIIRSLSIMDALRQQCGVKVLYSIKSLPLSAILNLAKPWVDGFSVSSLFEAQLAQDVLGSAGRVHLTTPGIRFDELDALLATVSHLSFNSLNQLQRFNAQNRPITASIGLRVNPNLSYVEDDRYNPCRLHSKLGVPIDLLWQTNELNNIKGLHIHTVFGREDYLPLLASVEKIIAYFGAQLKNLDWINLGGGYLFDQIQNHQPFIDLVRQLKKNFAVEVFVEPGKAIVGSAGYLVSTVIDCFVSDGKTIAVLDTSVNHLPEVFEYGLAPLLHEQSADGQFSVVLAGCSCLAGDLFGEYRFNSPLAIGDKLVFKNVGAYGLVKASRFNGINLPAIYSLQANQLHFLKQYDFQDFRQFWLTEC